MLVKGYYHIINVFSGNHAAITRESTGEPVTARSDGHQVDEKYLVWYLERHANGQYEIYNVGASLYAQPPSNMSSVDPIEGSDTRHYMWDLNSAEGQGIYTISYEQKAWCLDGKGIGTPVTFQNNRNEFTHWRFENMHSLPNVVKQPLAGLPPKGHVRILLDHVDSRSIAIKNCHNNFLMFEGHHHHHELAFGHCENLHHNTKFHIHEGSGGIYLTAGHTARPIFLNAEGALRCSGVGRTFLSTLTRTEGVRLGVQIQRSAPHLLARFSCERAVNGKTEVFYLCSENDGTLTRSRVENFSSWFAIVLWEEAAPVKNRYPEVLRKAAKPMEAMGGLCCMPT